MRITLVVPGLLSLPTDALARDPALSRMAALASPSRERDVESAVLADIPLDAASAPLAALGAGVDVGARWVARADPVSLVVGRDDARIDDIVLDLADREREMLLALLDAHFADDGVWFAAPRADAWFALTDAPQSVSGVSAEIALGVSLRELLPFGADAGRWRRFVTETQMLLHEHPLAARTRPVTSLWISGGGVLPARRGAPNLRAYATAGRDGDLLRGVASVLGGEALAVPATLREGFDVSKSEGLTIVALARVAQARELASLGVDFVVPALDALEGSRIDSLKLIASGNGGAASWTARRGSWLERWRRRRSAFVVPPSDRASADRPR